MQWSRVSHAAGPRWPTRNAFDRPQAESISAKWVDTEGAMESARPDTSAELIDKLKYLEGEENLSLLALMDRHAEMLSEAEGLRT
jgi:hypothetical protein